jgi:exopolysaccharide production protein ExoY
MTRALAKRAFAGSAELQQRELVAPGLNSQVHHLLRLPMTPVESWRYRFAKRFLDVLMASLMMAVLAVPAVFIALLIWMSSKGPVFYRERRIGRNGNEFLIWKFRSMRHDPPRHSHVGEARTGPVVLEWRTRKHGVDPRVTRIGAFLRRWSLDELPQLINVICGEMSLVGPRPIVESEAVYYGGLFAYYLAAKPGMSGLWQVSGRSDVGYDLRIKLDAIYVGSWTLKSDFVILLRTVPAVFGCKGAR